MAMAAFCHEEIIADGEVMQGTLSSPRIGQTRDIKGIKKTSMGCARSMPWRPWRSTPRARVRSDPLGR
jgi:hypothetical protein